jgi:hypothetical protein
MANFIMLCDCFLGMEPHFEPWRYCFRVKVQKNGRIVRDYGGENIQMRLDSDYLKL